MRKLKLFGIACSFALNACNAAVPSKQSQALGNEDAPIKYFWADNEEGQAAAAADAAAGNGNGINYYGGPLLLDTPNLYFIFYGSWNGDDAVEILSDFATNLGGSAYYNINTTYHDGDGNYVSNSVNYGGYVGDDYSYGYTLTGGNIRSIVAGVLDAGYLPIDTNGAYIVVTSPDIGMNGFCSSFCGWHTRANLSGYDIKYAFVGSPAHCSRPSSCGQRTISPNGNPNADALVNTSAHEFEEAVTDPDLNAWKDSSGRENADKCAWTFGATYTTDSGAIANMQLGARDFLIQQNWVNASGGYCDLSF